jgi:hypothetical protein
MLSRWKDELQVAGAAAVAVAIVCVAIFVLAVIVEGKPAPAAQTTPAPTPRVVELLEQNRKLREAHSLCNESRSKLDALLQAERSGRAPGSN